jgi:Leucine-rich repeat (LRR) protein
MLTPELKEIFKSISEDPDASQDKLYMELVSALREKIEKEFQRYSPGNQESQVRKEYVSYKDNQIDASEYRALEELLQNAQLSMENVLVTDDFSCYDSKQGGDFVVSVEDSHIIGLKINNSSLNDLKPIERLPMLQALCLYRNQIERIEGLKGLKKLLYLNLDSNQIQELEGLDDLTNLVNLDLRYNSISKIEGLDNLRKLENLILGGNTILKIEGLQKLENLRYVNLCVNALGKFEGFKGLKKLEGIDVDNNIIHKIEDNALDGLDCLKAVWILRNNSVSPNSSGMKPFYQKRVIQDYCASRWDRGSNWHFARMAEYVGVDFGDFETVDSLDFSWKENQVLQKNVDENGEVTGICIRGYQIADLKLFSGLTNLKKLYLPNNNIARIEGLDKLSELQELNLAANQIAKIEGLDKLADLDYLCLGENQIEKIEGLEGLKKLRGLALFGNKISKIEGLEQLDNLSVLNLCFNRISKLEGLTGLKKLATLALHYNQISDIKQFEGLDNLRNLSTLYISCNPISAEDMEKLREKGMVFSIAAERFLEHEKKEKQSQITAKADKVCLGEMLLGEDYNPPSKPEAKVSAPEITATDSPVDSAKKGEPLYYMQLLQQDKYEKPALTCENTDSLIGKIIDSAFSTDSPEARRKLAGALANMGMPDLALRATDKIAKGDFLMSNACQDIAMSYARQGDFEKALKLVPEIDNLGMKIRAWIEIAHCQIDMGKKKDAIKTLDIAANAAKGLTADYGKTAIVHSPETSGLCRQYVESAQNALLNAVARLKDTEPREPREIQLQSFSSNAYENDFKNAPELSPDLLHEKVEQIKQIRNNEARALKYMKYAFGQIRQKSDASELLRLAKETIPSIIKDCKDSDYEHVFIRKTDEAKRALAYAYAMNSQFSDAEQALSEIRYSDVKAKGNRDLAIVLAKKGHYSAAIATVPKIGSNDENQDALNALLDISGEMISKQVLEDRVLGLLQLTYNFLEAVKNPFPTCILMERYVGIMTHCFRLKKEIMNAAFCESFFGPEKKDEKVKHTRAAAKK